MDGKDVVPVHADRVDPVTDASACDAVPPVLLQRWRRDGVPVVSADEDRRAGAGGGYIQRGMEVAFAGGAFAKVAGYYRRGDVGVSEGFEF